MQLSPLSSSGTFSPPSHPRSSHSPSLPPWSPWKPFCRHVFFLFPKLIYFGNCINEIICYANTFLFIFTSFILLFPPPPSFFMTCLPTTSETSSQHRTGTSTGYSAFPLTKPQKGRRRMMYLRNHQKDGEAPSGRQNVKLSVSVRIK